MTSSRLQIEAFCRRSNIILSICAATPSASIFMLRSISLRSASRALTKARAVRTMAVPRPNPRKATSSVFRMVTKSCER
jgi:hypothetical protein